MQCLDCPDLEFSDDRPRLYKPRAVCCRDEHIARRIAGSAEPWEGHEAARAMSDAQPKPNRHARRSAAKRSKTDV